MNAMALVQRFGKPDIFLTITCNPNWLEIKQELGNNDEVQNRPDLVVRIFRAKLEELKIDLFKKQIFGPVAAYIYVIEFQKRGLPHAHFLIILKSSSKIISPEYFDKIVCAEIPNNNMYPHLYSIVLKHMMHDPCGILNPKNVCMEKNGKCRSHYPKAYASETSFGEDSYPKYRRRDDNKTVKVRCQYLDNRWVVPYNPYLLAKFDCHIHVEICSTIKAVKYLYKYVYKGHDRIRFFVNPNNQISDFDEIEKFQSARWISPPEAMWRIYGFILCEIYPSVISLQLHLENNQFITYKKSDDLTKVITRDDTCKTMLIEYFEMNVRNEKAKTLLYKEFPEHFVWDKKHKLWTPRKKGNVIGRIVTTNPTEGERYYLRLLLNHIKGATSFENLKVVNGISTSSFREAALLHGLLNGDNNSQLCLEEASLYQMPCSLRRLFATILAFCCLDEPKTLWNGFREFLCEDYTRNGMVLQEAELKTLQFINSVLEPIGKNVNDYGIVDYDVNLRDDEKLAKIMDEELGIVISDLDISSVNSLNKEQKIAYDMILEKVFA